MLGGLLRDENLMDKIDKFLLFHRDFILVGWGKINIYTNK